MVAPGSLNNTVPPQAYTETGPIDLDAISGTELAQQFGSTNEIISWLFSDTMLANVQNPLLSPNDYSLDSPMSLQNLLSPPAYPEKSGISEAKQGHMIEFMPEVAASLASNGIPEETPFSQRYIDSYWLNFHAQFPILHMPTFCADTCPSGLLWAVIAIGAALLKEATLAKCIATPLRWAIFQHEDSHPPAQLWVIQALLLLETYENSQTDRKLHVRAIIHHGTTLQLIRRGAILTDSSGENSKSSSVAADGQETHKTEKDPWKRWIQGEAAKRAALMAFVLDIYHNALYGHISLISIHEIRLSLPCSNTLWDTFPQSEHRKTSQSTTLPVIEALKLTLNKRPVNTSPFGRKVLLAGLISISLLMQQRDFQIDSLGWFNSNNPQFHSMWKAHLKDAYDFWSFDFGRSLKLAQRHYHNHLHPDDIQQNGGSGESASGLQTLESFKFLVSGCADPFAHLAPINLSVSLLDLHIYAGAPNMFSRVFRSADFEKTVTSITAWAMSPGGKEAVRHAIGFLEEMYCPTPQTRLCPNPYTALDTMPGSYLAKDDPLVHRPHAIFVCTLTVWAYGFAIGGPESTFAYPPGHADDTETKKKTMKPVDLAASVQARLMPLPVQKQPLVYINWLSQTLANPDPAPTLANDVPKYNETAGLLKMVINSLQGTTWMLADETSRLLTHCLERTLGKPGTSCPYHIV